MKKFLEALENRKLFYVLLLLNFIASVLIFYAFRSKLGGDRDTYLGLAEGIRHGRYSFWWFLPEYVPDTFRNPGYPLFVLLLTSIYDSVLFVQLVQLALYFVTILLALKVIEKYNNGFAVKNIFILLLLPSLQIVATTTAIMPDSVTAFFIMLWIYVYEKWDHQKWSRFILIGIISGIIFQLRPVFLFVPFITVVVDYIILRRNFPVLKNLTIILIYVSTMVPYGVWNYQNHGVFKITSLEGGGGVMHISYWSFKLPGYTDTRYWSGNIMSDEVVSFTNRDEIEKNIAAYNKEWDYIDSACAKYETHADTIILEQMKAMMPGTARCLTHNTAYTLERERLLKQLTVKHFLEEPLFTFKTKIYTVFRHWITGIQRDDLKGSFAAKVMSVYPFVVSFIAFIGFLIVIPIVLIRKKLKLAECANILLLLIYFGLIHLPFTVQARYTIPVRMLLLMLLAVGIYRLFTNKKVPGLKNS